MVLMFTTLADENVDRVVSDPPLVWQVVAPEEPEFYQQARQERAKPSFLGKLFGTSSAPAPPPADLTLGDGEGIAIDLDKSWHGIHYLLTGSAEEADQPLSFLVAGGRTIGEIEVGYGPARVFTSAETQAISKALETLTAEELRSRFDPADMTVQNIYPEIWNRSPAEQDTLGYLLEHFAILREGVKNAADNKLGIVVALL
jgi:hypothetical protein